MTTQERRRSQGLCPVCGGQRESEKYVNCEKCRAHAAEYKRVRIATEPEYSRVIRKARDSEYQRRYLAKRKELGICRLCKNPVLPGHSLCKEHNDQNNQKARERYYQKKEAASREE